MSFPLYGNVANKQILAVLTSSLWDAFIASLKYSTIWPEENSPIFLFSLPANQESKFS